MNNQVYNSKRDLITTCKVAPLKDRRQSHLLIFKIKEKENINLLKKHSIQTRLHTAPVFDTYKPKNKKAKANIIYRGAIEWNKLPANDRNLNLEEFKKPQNRNLTAIYT